MVSEPEKLGLAARTVPAATVCGRGRDARADSVRGSGSRGLLRADLGERGRGGLGRARARAASALGNRRASCVGQLCGRGPAQAGAGARGQRARYPASERRHAAVRARAAQASAGLNSEQTATVLGQPTAPAVPCALCVGEEEEGRRAEEKFEEVRGGGLKLDKRGPAAAVAL